MSDIKNQRQDIINCIRENISDISLDITSVLLFGSWARREAGSDSDIDILVAAEGLPEKKRQRIPQIKLIKEKLRLPCPMEVLLLTPDECSSNFENHLPLFLDIAFDGILIYDKNNFLKNEIKKIQVYVRNRNLIREKDGWRFPVKYREATPLSEVSNKEFADAMLKDSERDIIIAEEIIKLGIYEKSVYHSQQSIEKAIKAILIAFGTYKKSHFVGKILKEEIAHHEIPKKWEHKLQQIATFSEDIEPEVTWSRYVGIDKDTLWVPCEEYTKSEAEKTLKKAKKVLKVSKEFIGWWFKESGLSLIATILALLLFSLFIAVAVSLVTTGAHIGIQEEQGQQAFYIAEGGIQYAAKTRSFPNYIVTPAVNLGKGSFTTSVPTLSGDIDITDPLPSMDVSSTDGFLQAPDNNYWTTLCDDYAGGHPTPDLSVSSTCEKISFTTQNPTSFTGGTRGRHSSDAASHLDDAVVLTYSWNTSITTNLNGATSASTTTICVDGTAGFTIPGFIQIADTNPNENQTEDAFCRGSGSGAATCGASCTASCFTGCTREAFNGNGNGPAHSDNTTVYQSEIGVLTTSTGVISNIIASNVRRVVQVNAGPSEE